MFRPVVLVLTALAVGASAARSSDESALIAGRFKVADLLAILKKAKNDKDLDPVAKEKARNQRIAALALLATSGGKNRAVVKGVIETLKEDPEPKVRVAAARALGQMGKEARGAIEALAD